MNQCTIIVYTLSLKCFFFSHSSNCKIIDDNISVYITYSNSLFNSVSGTTTTRISWPKFMGNDTRTSSIFMGWWPHVKRSPHLSILHLRIGRGRRSTSHHLHHPQPIIATTTNTLHHLRQGATDWRRRAKKNYLAWLLRTYVPKWGIVSFHIFSHWVEYRTKKNYREGNIVQ